jgi:hypothetical protein
MQNHLAKVRVAGSNPVFRSNEGPGRAWFFVLLAGGVAVHVGLAGADRSTAPSVATLPSYAEA